MKVRQLFRLSGMVWVHREYHSISKIRFTNYKKKGKIFYWRRKKVDWTFHIEIGRLKIFICRFAIQSCPKEEAQELDRISQEVIAELLEEEKLKDI